MDLKAYFNVRFLTKLNGLDFYAETQCDDLSALAKLCYANSLAASAGAPEVDLVAAEMRFDLARPPETGRSGCYILDDESEELLNTILKTLRVGAQHFFNERLGSYDKYNNRVSPMDMGILFPDGTLRVVWSQEDSLLDFDETFQVLHGALGMLLELQETPYGSQTEAELEDNEYEPLKTRRVEALFEAGLWPADDDTFEPGSAQELQALLMAYRIKPVSQP